MYVYNTVVSHEDGASVAVDFGRAGYLVVHFDGFVTGKTRWAWRVTNEYGRTLGEDNDLHSPEFEHSLGALRSLVSFLSAAAEAHNELSENWTLFNDTVRTWAKENSSELEMVALTIDEAIERMNE